MKHYILLIILLLFTFLLGSCEDDIYIPDENNQETNIETSYILIDLKGEVVRTGIYQVKSGIILYDLIIQAGGLTPQADTSTLNLAEYITDNKMIYIPRKGSNSTNTDKSNKININTASVSELTTLEKIGEVIASRIIEYRETNGNFKTIEEIKNVKGISDGVFNKIKDYITV